MIQVAIAILGLLTAWFYNSKSPAAVRWGPVTSLCAQPLWLYVSYHSAQWGIFALALFYITMASRGCWHHWRQDGVQ